MSAVTLGLLAAVANAGQGVLSKGLTQRYPPRQLIGPLLLINCFLLLPFAPFVEWRWSSEIVLFHAISAILLIVSSVPIWDMFGAGAASATMTAQALSPLATAIGAAVLLPGTTGPLQVVAAIAVVAGVTWALQGAFEGLGRRGSVVRVLLAAASTGMLTVVTRLLADLDVGVVETYVVRTGVAALAVLVLIRPRQVPWSAGPRLLVRSLAVTTYYVFVILAVQEGSPVVVQTMVAVTPLLTIGYESLRDRTLPSARSLAGAALVIVGVAVVLGG